MEMMKRFWQYRQNNSRGKFKLPAIVVWVEADTAEEADLIAEMNGIYFNNKEDDCSCCGSRWEPATQSLQSLPETREPNDSDLEWSEQSGVPAQLVILKEKQMNEQQAAELQIEVDEAKRELQVSQANHPSNRSKEIWKKFADNIVSAICSDERLLVHAPVWVLERVVQIVEEKGAK